MKLFFFLFNGLLFPYSSQNIEKNKLIFMEKGGLTILLSFQIEPEKVKMFQILSGLLRNLCKQGLLRACLAPFQIISDHFNLF